MKKINKFLLLAILLLLFLSNCQKKEKNQKMPKIENESEQIFEDVSSDKLLELDNMSEEEKKELLEMSEKNEKLDIYFKNWMEIVKYLYLIDVYKDYKNTFLDENNNFIETDEKIYIVGFLDETNERKKGVRYEPFDIKFSENENWVKKIYFKEGIIYIWDN